MCTIYLFCATFASQVMFSVLVGSLCEDLGEDLESWTHINSTSTIRLVWPTLIGLFSGAVSSPHLFDVAMIFNLEVLWARMNIA